MNFWRSFDVCELINHLCHYWLPHTQTSAHYRAHANTTDFDNDYDNNKNTDRNILKGNENRTKKQEPRTGNTFCLSFYIVHVVKHLTLEFSARMFWFFNRNRSNSNTLALIAFSIDAHEFAYTLHILTRSLARICEFNKLIIYHFKQSAIYFNYYVCT